MKKTVIIIGIVTFVVIVTFFVFGKKTQAPTIIQNQVATQHANGEKKSDQPQENSKPDLFGFLSKGGVKCTIDDESGKFTVSSNGTKVKIEGIPYVDIKNPTGGEKPGTMFTDGTWAYIWSGNSGIKFNIKDMQAASGNQENFKVSDWQDWAKSMQESGAKYDCSPTVLSDADLSVPTNVQFQDLGEMMKKLQDLGNQYKNVDIPSIPDFSN